MLCEIFGDVAGQLRRVCAVCGYLLGQFCHVGHFPSLLLAGWLADALNLYGGYEKHGYEGEEGEGEERPVVEDVEEHEARYLHRVHEDHGEDGVVVARHFLHRSLHLVAADALPPCAGLSYARPKV